METIAVLATVPLPAGGARGVVSTGSSTTTGASLLRSGRPLFQCKAGASQVASCCLSLGSGSLCRGRIPSARGPALPALSGKLHPKLRQRGSSRTTTIRASVEENSEAKVEEATEELEKQAEESKAAYSEAIDSLKDNTVKLQQSAKEAYEPKAEKAIEVLRDTTEKLKEEASRARALLTATAIETAELGKSNLSSLAESGPDPIKDIAESAVNAHLKENTKQGAKIHDFCLGIPYGAILVAGGLLWFIITGSTAAIRFGVILGGLLLFLSVKSLKVWKEGKSSIPYIQGQAAIALLIFVKDARTFAKTGAVFPPLVSALASGAILAFYAYVYLSGGNPPKKEKIAEPTSAA